VPRVSEQYIEQRRRTILDAAARRFARDGFHATTMDDVIGEAGMSASVVYRWFRGKEELIAASVTDVADVVVAELEAVLAAATPVPLGRAVGRLLAAAVDATAARGGDELIALTLQAWTEALRNTSVNDAVVSRYRQVRDGLAELVRQHQRAGSLPAHIDPDAAAAVVSSLVPGTLVQHLLLGPVDVDAFTAACSAILVGADD
jgi:TetR/AcrR family transcriptional regulator, transcriptional repressor of aconitase